MICVICTNTLNVFFLIWVSLLSLSQMLNNRSASDDNTSTKKSLLHKFWAVNETWFEDFFMIFFYVSAFQFQINYLKLVDSYESWRFRKNWNFFFDIYLDSIIKKKIEAIELCLASALAS